MFQVLTNDMTPNLNTITGKLFGELLNTKLNADNSKTLSLLSSKLKLIEVFKDSHKNSISQIEAMKFPCLSKIITQNCGSILNNENAEIICNICNKFSATNNKSLAAHQRACKKNSSRNSIIIKN